MTEYKRPGNKPQAVVLTDAVRADLKTRGFKESPDGTFMSRNIDKVHISIYTDGKCYVNLIDSGVHIQFSVDRYWVRSILYFTQQELNREADRMRKEAETLVKYAEKVMDVVSGKTKN